MLVRCLGHYLWVFYDLEHHAGFDRLLFETSGKFSVHITYNG